MCLFVLFVGVLESVNGFVNGSVEEEVIKMGDLIKVEFGKKEKMGKLRRSYEK